MDSSHLRHDAVLLSNIWWQCDHAKTLATMRPVTVSHPRRLHSSTYCQVMLLWYQTEVWLSITKWARFYWRVWEKSLKALVKKIADLKSEISTWDLLNARYDWQWLHYDIWYGIFKIIIGILGKIRNTWEYWFWYMAKSLLFWDIM